MSDLDKIRQRLLLWHDLTTTADDLVMDVLGEEPAKLSSCTEWLLVRDNLIMDFGEAMWRLENAGGD